MNVLIIKKRIYLSARKRHNCYDLGSNRETIPRTKGRKDDPGLASRLGVPVIPSSSWAILCRSLAFR